MEERIIELGTRQMGMLWSGAETRLGGRPRRCTELFPGTHPEPRGENGPGAGTGRDLSARAAIGMVGRQPGIVVCADWWGRETRVSIGCRGLGEDKERKSEEARGAKERRRIHPSTSAPPFRWWAGEGPILDVRTGWQATTCGTTRPIRVSCCSRFSPVSPARQRVVTYATRFRSSACREPAATSSGIRAFPQTACRPECHSRSNLHPGPASAESSRLQ